jgi:hypothetical protein
MPEPTGQHYDRMSHMRYRARGWEPVPGAISLTQFVRDACYAPHLAELTNLTLANLLAVVDKQVGELIVDDASEIPLRCFSVASVGARRVTRRVPIVVRQLRA